jgi:hypothetical protein
VPIAERHELITSHENGPQIGLLAPEEATRWSSTPSACKITSPYDRDASKHEPDFSVEYVKNPTFSAASTMPPLMSVGASTMLQAVASAASVGTEHVCRGGWGYGCRWYDCGLAHP